MSSGTSAAILFSAPRRSKEEIALRGTKKSNHLENKGEAGSRAPKTDSPPDNEASLGPWLSATTLTSIIPAASNYFGRRIRIMFRLHISSSILLPKQPLYFLPSLLAPSCLAGEEGSRLLRCVSSAYSSVLSPPSFSFTVLSQDGWRGFASSVGVWQNDRALRRLSGASEGARLCFLAGGNF